MDLALTEKSSLLYSKKVKWRDISPDFSVIELIFDIPFYNDPGHNTVPIGQFFCFDQKQMSDPNKSSKYIVKKI